MAVGPTLGTGLFIGAGEALAVGGPASLLMSYAFLSFLTYSMATTVAEVATHMPSEHGTMVTHGYQYMSSSMGFATAMLRWYSMAMLVPFETTTAMVNLGVWQPGRNVTMRLGLITSIVVGTNFLPERFIKMSEVLFTRIKAGTMVAFLALSLSIGLGGASGHEQWGFKYWKDPGAMREYLAHGSLGRFLGLLQCLLHAAVAFAFAPELIVHRAENSELAEATKRTENGQAPQSSSIPSRTATDVLQTVFPYVLSAVAMGVMAPFNEPQLSNNGAGAGLSPFVIGLKTAQVNVLPVTATIAIFLSCVASGRSFLYQSSRILCAMSELGYAPQMFQSRNRWGVPWIAVATSASFTGVAFLSAMRSSSVVCNWLLRFVTTSGYISWLSSCIVYRRFHQQMKRDETIPRDRFAIQPMATSFGILASAGLLVFGGLNAVAPSTASESRPVRAITTYSGIPVFLFLYVGHRFNSRTLPKKQRWADNNRPAEPGEGVHVVPDSWPRRVHGQPSNSFHPLGSFEMQEHPRMVGA
ncbi:hypothetical protein N7510_009782 [Penicillium lagena]|uniref:uncharacterized protein n=1 Tax=Penicillium lagena TaxID=94218 RepID=UPI0025401BC3|nr:uncharacterized protein N7510_009782 [Penicillium lagena]KAJ5604628.1 hypothetical protein N7510_009782 [Penicillium lagena]